MKPVDWAILAIVALAVFFAVRKRRRGGCCGDCGCCGAECRCEKTDASSDKKG